MAERKLETIMASDTKMHCGCSKRGKFINRNGEVKSRRIHEKSCKYSRRVFLG